MSGMDFPRQALHAWKLALNHPDTGAPMQFEAPLPGDMEGLVKSLS
jgi:23S rRNA pseudouridine1911/1915/1917 synthase